MSLLEVIAVAALALLTVGVGALVWVGVAVWRALPLLATLSPPTERIARLERALELEIALDEIEDELTEIENEIDPPPDNVHPLKGG